MKNICDNNFIICLGDDIRYRFAQELMPDGHVINSNSLKINKSYIFVYSEEENVIADERKVMVYTSKIQEGRILEFPVSGIDVKTVLVDQGKIRIGKILVFADFPYKKENLHYLVEKICRKSKNAEINVILYNENRRAGYTDIERSDRILKEAYNDFRMFDIGVYEYSAGSDKRALMKIQTKNMKYFTNKYLKELKGSQYRLENRFEIHYKTFLERTYEHYFSFNNPHEFGRFVKLFEYGNVPERTTDVWSVFRDEFKKIYLSEDSDIMNEISEFYLDYISEILNFKLDEEEKFVKQVVWDIYEKCFENYPVIATGKNELEYKEILNKNNIITEFTKKIDEYFHALLKKQLFIMAQHKINAVKKALNREGEVK